ncbi:MAG TPA: bacteriohemerythrin [Spirochaetota bacterium]|nr:bacteriohemerythrin [Spirochaetota bacterium]HQE60160.1 bacteriohemerythrin [Spirochaetota bacterium]
MIVWDQSLSVGIEQFDGHHKELIRIITELHNSMTRNENRVYLKNLLFELVSYTKYHFTAEERYMQKYHYQEYDQHHEEHKKLTEQVEQFLDEYSLGKKDIDTELFDFLKHWLFNHILETDKKMGIYLKRAGLS